MFNTASTIQTVPRATSSDEASSVAQTRSNFLQLQALVTVVLSYELLFGQDTLLTGDGQNVALLGLMLICGSLIVLPAHVIVAEWFPGVLALSDTAITTAMIYLSGNATSDLYLTYFVIILIITTTRTAKQRFMFLSIVCVFYGISLYREIGETGLPLENHLLRVPLLLIMAIFYGRTVDSARNLTDYDSVTGLPNRRQFLRLVAKGLAGARRTKRQIAVLFLDLDGFKLINETLGHAVGDQLLKEVATRLTDCVQQTAIIARQGGDEFTILSHNVPSSDHVALLAQETLSSIVRPFRLAARDIFITTSIGIALYPQDADDADSLIKHADTAMSRAKQQGKNLYQFYSADMNVQAYERLVLENSLRKAVEQDELLVHYQPQINLATGHIVGVEALARWNQRELGLVLPEQFIPIAEETGLIVSIGEWVLRKACLQVKAWHEGGWPAVQLSANISARQFKQPDLVAMVSRVLRETGLRSNSLELELTESITMETAETTIRTLHDLKALGIRLSIDDFGTGYSSLSYLTRFPIDTLKIDQTFIRDITTSPDAEAVVTAILAMAQALKLKVIAEGVETEAQETFLMKHGCHEAQGFHYSKPLTTTEMAEFLRRWPKRLLHTAF
jgi:diguanylate cyclase (GGDEF)-like protein